MAPTKPPTDGPSTSAARPASRLSTPSASGRSTPIPASDPTLMLPPRLAARFSRPSAPTKPPSRKSCASSRRSSVSSRSAHHHRHHHHGHHGAAPASVAQHLRRASILESRRARLASRAAHAEEVRQRAQQIQAAPRSTRTRGEEKAAAAQVARERYLAQVAASCAEEVKKAKRVAEETRARKMEEGMKLREEVERGLEKAERRKREYWEGRRRARGGSLGIVGEEKGGEEKAEEDGGVARKIASTPVVSEEGAARIVQRAWMGHQRKRTVRDFLELNMDVSRIEATTFNEVSELLARDEVLARTAKMMRLCGLLDGTDDESSASVRIFLSAFLLLGHPKQVLNAGGDLEEDLIDRAKVLLMQFQRVLSRPPTAANYHAAAEPITSLNEAFADFQLTFSAWKNHDSSILVDTMLAQFAELDAIWQTVKGDTAGNVAADYKEGIRYNQTLLIARLKRMAGPEKALKMANEAVRARRKIKTGAKARGDVKPRSASVTTGDGPSMSLNKEPSSRAATPLEPTPEQPPTSGDGTSHAEILKSMLSPMPPNRVFVHELSISRDYRIDVDAICSQRRDANQALLSTIRADLATDRGQPWILALAETIRDRLLRVVPAGKPVHHQIAEALDLDTIAHQLRAGAFSYDSFFAFMNGLLPKLVAPARDPLVKALAQDAGDDFVERLAKLLNVVNHLSLDFANHLLALAAPDLLRHAAEYEEGCFRAERAEPATASLPLTTRWWRAARAQALTEHASRSSASHPSPAPSAQSIYTTGLLTLFLCPLPPPSTTTTNPPLPETLALDTDRLARFRADTLRLLTSAACLLTAKNLLKRDVRVPWHAAARRLWALPAADFYAPESASIVISAMCEQAPAPPSVPPAARQALEGAVPRLLSDAKAAHEGRSEGLGHPVMKVLLVKVRRHVGERLRVDVGSRERVRAAAGASEELGKGGLAEFVGRVGGWVEELGRVRGTDWEAHGKWLEAVAGRVEGGRGRSPAEGEGEVHGVRLGGGS